MPASFQFVEHNGAPDLVPSTAGSVTTSVNWKSVDDAMTAGAGTPFSDAPLVAGTNSFEKWQFGRITGTYTQLLNGRFAHTAGALPTGTTLFGPPSMSQDSHRRIYATPSRDVAPDNVSTRNLTSITLLTGIAQGAAVWFGLSSPGSSGKAAAFTGTGAVVFTNYLVTQLRTEATAVSGTSAAIVLTVRFDEN